MIYTLESNNAVLKVDTRNCEVASFKRKDKDIEYMWGGSSEYWANRNPILFPHIGSPKDKILNFKGTDYKVNNHGFLRNSEFVLVEQSDDYLTFEFNDNEESYKQYPYHFKMIVKYTLKDNEVIIDYRIINKEEGKLYFGFGLHPAFNCPLDENKSFSDYWIEFDEDDVQGKRLMLSYELFDKYPTYIIENPLSRKISLSDGDNKVVMSINDKFKTFALWTPKAPFICLEPWINTFDYEESNQFEKLSNMLVLDKDEEYKVGYSYKVE